VNISGVWLRTSDSLRTPIEEFWLVGPGYIKALSALTWNNL